MKGTFGDHKYAIFLIAEGLAAADGYEDFYKAPAVDQTAYMAKAEKMHRYRQVEAADLASDDYQEKA